MYSQEQYRLQTVHRGEDVPESEARGRAAREAEELASFTNRDILHQF